MDMLGPSLWDVWNNSGQAYVEGGGGRVLPLAGVRAEFAQQMSVCP